uniref:Uncharacterized protein n=1 Tax=Sinocyclocheilus grahami TaxID=75366 RepID=A0A672MCM1_SINGR
MTSVGRAAAADDAPLHQSCVPALTRSWPSSPLSALSSSRQVTARLYSSLQHSREQEVKGHAASLICLSDLSDHSLMLFYFCLISSGRKHIEEMENVRTHLQSILRNTPTSADRHDFLAPASQHFLDDSHESDCFVMLLSQILYLAFLASDRKCSQTLQLVEGWKRHDQERNEEMKHLQEEKEMAERTRNTHKQALSHVEQNLSQVEEKLNQEQKHKQELQKANKHLEQEARELRLRVEELQQEEQKLRRDADRLREQLHKLQTESHDTRTHAQQLQQQLTHATQKLHTHMEQVKQEVATREEAESRTRQIQEELEQIRRERDALRVDRALEQTRFEAQKSQMEAEFRLSLERQINERLTAIQEENATHNAQLRQQHRKQLLDLSARHERELAAQLDQFRTQLQEKDDKLQHLTHSYQHKLSEMQEELVSMAASKRKLEAQREELVSRLQGMMRSHWAEALRLLTNQEQMESFLSPVAQWEASKTSSSPLKRDTHASAPQAVVLHLSREKERGMRSEEQETRAPRETSSHSEFGLLNCSTSFCPLEPVLEHTDMTG